MVPGKGHRGAKVTGGLSHVTAAQVRETSPGTQGKWQVYLIVLEVMASLKKEQRKREGGSRARQVPEFCRSPGPSCLTTLRAGRRDDDHEAAEGQNLPVPPSAASLVHSSRPAPVPRHLVRGGWLRVKHPWVSS